MPLFATNGCWPILSILCTALTSLSMAGFSQPMSGVWKGRIGAQTFGAGRSYWVEMTMVRDGDSLRGLSDYRTQGNHHVRMPVNGYVNPYDGSVTWWHAALSGHDENGRTVPDLLPIGMTFHTDFNCPDGSTLKLDGTAHISTWSGRTWEIPVHLKKTAEIDFQDDVKTGIVRIDLGIEDAKLFPRKEENPPASKPIQRSERPVVESPASPKAIVPVQSAPSNPVVQTTPRPVVTPTPTPIPPEPTIRQTDAKEAPQRVDSAQEKIISKVSKATQPVVRTTPQGRTSKPAQVSTDEPRQPLPSAPSPIQPTKTRDPKEAMENKPSPLPQPLHLPTLSEPKSEEMFVTRSKNLVQEIEVAGDTLWLHFYDHAEVDGDSISIFLDKKLIASHIRLRATAHTMGIPVTAIKDSADITMVAENMGTIPPNTSLLIMYVDGVRYEARLESTEKTSAMIRFRKPIRKS